MNLNDLIYNNIPRLVIALIVALVYAVRGPIGAVAVLTLSVVFTSIVWTINKVYERARAQHDKELSELLESNE